MKKILIISTYYQPIQSVASNRINAFAKYLHQFGYNVTVLTCGDVISSGDFMEDGIRVIRLYVGKSMWSAFDTQNDSCRIIHYIKCFYNIFISNLSIDACGNWTQKAILKARELMRENEYDYILSSVLPVGPHYVALDLKERYPKIKWIADMRDAISEPRSNTFFYKCKMRCLVQRVVDKCDWLLAVSKPQLKLFRSYYKGSEKNKFHEIRNGFDYVFLPKKQKNKKALFSIIYAGNFYGARKPKNFFQALLNVMEKENFSIEVRIIGNKAPIDIPNRLRGIVKEETAVSYNNVCEEMRNADALLMVSPSYLEKGIYTGKLFDYLGSGSPIIALVPPNDVAGQLIMKAKAGYVVANEDVIGIENVIKRAYSDWKNNKFFEIDQRIVLAHQRKEQVRRLVNILKIGSEEDERL